MDLTGFGMGYFWWFFVLVWMVGWFFCLISDSWRKEQNLQSYILNKSQEVLMEKNVYKYSRCYHSIVTAVSALILSVTDLTENSELFLIMSCSAELRSLTIYSTDQC